MIASNPSTFARGPRAQAILAAVAIASAAFIAGCRSAPTRIFTLEPIATTASQVVYSGPSLRIDVVHVPPSLDRIEILTEIAPGELKINDLAHWAAPLGQLARGAETADLMARLPTGKVTFPDLAKSAGQVGVNIDILSFSANARGARLEASWVVTSDDPAAVSPTHAASLADDRPAADAAATARALSALLALLADRISRELGLAAVH
jgi:uncharacterized lipoprotein YmbA